jgi:acetyl-CoA carboxylase biotin carboxyl carrier protein
MKKPSGAQTVGPAQSVVDVAAVDQLARIVSKYDLSEVEVSLGDLQVRVVRERAHAAQTNIAAAPAAAPAPANSAQGLAPPSPAVIPPAADMAGAVKSPMVGTAYLRASPDAKPFVEIGSMVKVGDKLLLVEAMKTFNDIVATRAGKVVSILVEDGSPVEYDQPLMIVE